MVFRLLTLFKRERRLKAAIFVLQRSKIFFLATFLKKQSGTLCLRWPDFSPERGSIAQSRVSTLDFGQLYDAP
jgi:hypothetical protein